MLFHNQGQCAYIRASFSLYVFCAFFSFSCEFGYQYQCNQLNGEICLHNDLLCAVWDVKFCTCSCLILKTLWW